MVKQLPTHTHSSSVENKNVLHVNIQLVLYNDDDKTSAASETASLEYMTVPAGCIMEVVATATGIRRMVESCRAVEHQVTL